MKKKLSTHNHALNAAGYLTGWIRENKICFLSFLLPFVSMLAIFIGNGIFPFGDESFMHSDMYHQYVPFLEEFLRKVRSGDSLFYSRNVGMGSNYLALYIYYSASPLNWLMLLVPAKYLIEFMSYMVVFKIGLCGFTFSYYLKQRFYTKDYTIVLFSVFYAMSGFVAAYNWNVMWMDCLFLAPLILLGLERLVKEGKSALYCIALALSILSNYYISIMICLFLCLYFLVLLPQIQNNGDGKANLKRTALAAGRFALYSLLAGGIAAVLLLPELAALNFTEFADSTFPKKVTWYFSFLDVIARHATGVKRETGLDHWPNIFCSSAVFFLIPLYVFNKKIALREKVGRLFLCAFLIVSFSVNTLNFIWHGFNYPDSLPCRQSFLYIFLVLTMCFETLHRPEGFSNTDLLRSLSFALFFLLLSEKLVEDDAFSTGIFLLSAALVCAYGLLVYLYKAGISTSRAVRLATVLALMLATFESTFNMSYTSVSTTSRSKYLESLPAYETLASRTMENDPDFYRFEKFSRVTKNDGTLVGYPTASLFSSTANANVENWYDRMGMSESKVFYCFDGQTPLSGALLNVRYMFSRSDGEDPSLYALIDEQDGVFLYKTIYTLPAGFILNDDWNLSSLALEDTSSDPFDLQNQMAASVVEGSALFEPVELTEYDGEAQFTADVSGHYYAYCKRSKVDNVKVTSDSLNKTFKKVKYDYILDLGRHEAGDYITLSNEDDGALEATAALLNEDVLAQMLDALGQQPFVADSHDSTHLSGHIEVTSPGKLILSVAYEPGWRLKVDGQEAEIEMYDEMFISVDLEEGSHTIELDFCPAGLPGGIVISLTSLAAFVFLQILKRKYGEDILDSSLSQY